MHRIIGRFMAGVVLVAVAAAAPLGAQELSFRFEGLAGVPSTLPLPCRVSEGSPTAVLRSELRLAERLARRGSGPEWLELACLRTSLYQSGTLGRVGLLMPPGTSWHQGAINALLQIDPPDSASAELLGWLALNENGPEPRDLILAHLSGSRHQGVLSLRACTMLARLPADPAAGAECIRRGLAYGADSTWHLLEMARWLAMDADTAAATERFELALAAARSADDWAHVEWHLGWFLEPEERAAWDTLADSSRIAWVRNSLATRDVRDGRPPGSRLAQHFKRLEFVSREFRMAMPRKALDRFRLAATQESGLDPQYARKSSEPGLAAADPYRLYLRTYPDYDDRAAVWMRFGRPADRILWSHGGGAVADGRGKFNSELGAPAPSGSIANVREVWQYELDDGSLLLSFEGEQFDASQEATRLVAGVLGTYFCDVDSYRCALTNRSKWLAEMMPFPGSEARPLPRETIETLRNDDLNHIRDATTRDDNSLRTTHHLTTSASLHRLWHPVTGELIAVAPYAVRIRDIARSGDSAVVVVTLRQWDSGEGNWREKVEFRRVLLPRNASSDSWLTGHLEVPTSPTLSSWSIIARQDTTHAGRVWKDRVATLSSVAGLSVSDLIVGAESQGVSWRAPGSDPIPLAPLGAFDRSQPVTLSWQVRTAAPLENVITTIAFHRLGRRESDGPALEVSIPGRLSPGLSLMQRELGVDRLEAGRYRIELIMQLPDGRRVTRIAPMELN